MENNQSLISIAQQKSQPKPLVEIAQSKQVDNSLMGIIKQKLGLAPNKITETDKGISSETNGLFNHKYSWEAKAQPKPVEPPKDIALYHDEKAFNEYKPVINKVENEMWDRFGEDMRGVTSSILSSESSWGKDATNYNKDIGEYAYLVGMTQEAADVLRERGEKVNLDTKEGALRAALTYYHLRGRAQKDDGSTNEEMTNTYQSNKGRRYQQRYYGGKEQVESKFNSLYNYYVNR